MLPKKQKREALIYRIRGASIPNPQINQAHAVAQASVHSCGFRKLLAFEHRIKDKMLLYF